MTCRKTTQSDMAESDQSTRRKKSFPIAWVTSDRHLMILGGCDGELCRLKKALEFDWARISVFRRTCCEPLCSDCPNDERMTVFDRLPEEQDVAESDLIFESTMCRPLAERITPWARQHGVPINSMDKLDLCDFHYTSLLIRGPIVLSIVSGGQAPAVVSRLRRMLQETVGPGWETAARLFEELRESLPAGQARNALLKNLAADPKLDQWIQENDETQMRQWINNASQSLDITDK